jgi:hypothetical protein
MENFADVADNVARIRSDVKESLDKSGRSGEPVTIVAVTKTFPAPAVRAAVEAGLTEMGESRVQETISKKPEVDVDCKWHLIGHLQKNKINKALELYDMIQSVDSFRLAAEIDQRTDKPIDILLQVNSSGEETKFGLEPESLMDTAKRISELSKIKIAGIMTIGPLTDDIRQIRHSFKLTRQLFEDLKSENISGTDIRYLSMGMTHDYKLAIEEGSNMIRVGTAIFGERGQRG